MGKAINIKYMHKKILNAKNIKTQSIGIKLRAQVPTNIGKFYKY